MRRALAPLELEKRVGPETEWTMEANPSSVDRKRLEEYRALPEDGRIPLLSVDDGARPGDPIG